MIVRDFRKGNIMKFEGFTLYSTNLYPSHENVIIPCQEYNSYDPNNTNGKPIKSYNGFYNYYDYLLKELYNYETTNLNNARSIKLFDELFCYITIDKRAEDVIKNNYNYISIKTKYNQEYLYYFIIDVESLNDNDLNPSCKLSLKYDSWGNHYYDIYNKGVKGNLIKGHYTNTKLNGNTLNIKNLSTTTPNFQTSSIINSIYNTNRVIWLEVVLSENIDIECSFRFKRNGSIFSNIYTKTDYSLVNQYGKYMFYIPYAIKDFNSNELIDISEVGNYYVTGKVTIEDIGRVDISIGNGTPDNIEFLYDYSRVTYENMINQQIAPFVESARLTYYVPFEYSIINGNSIILHDNMFLSVTKIRDVEIRFPYLYVVGLEPARISPYLFEPTIPFSSRLELVEYHNIPLNEAITFRDLESTYNLNVNTLISKRLPPIYSKNLIINNERYFIPLNDNMETEARVIISKTTSQPYVTIYVDGENVSRLGTFILTTPIISYTVSSLVDYQIRNGSQHQIELEIGKLNKMSNIRNGIYGVVGNTVSAIGSIYGFNNSMMMAGKTGLEYMRGGYENTSLLRTAESYANKGTSQQFSGLGSAVGAIKGIGDTVINAKLAQKSIDMLNGRITDADNSPDTMISSRGENDVYILDMIFVEENNFIGNDIYVDNILYSEYRYGITPVVVENILNRHKTSFDYKLFSDTDLSMINLPLKILNDLSSMFNNGFTIHYCDGYTGEDMSYNFGFHITSDISINKNFDINTLINTDKEFRFDNDYITWLGRQV